MQTPNHLYLRLSSLAVFRHLLEIPLVRAFMRYCEADALSAKLSAYGEFVSEIYRHGGDLTAFVKTAVFEDENVYITSAAIGESCISVLEEAKENELSALESFATMTPEDFRKDMGYDGFLPRYTLSPISLSAEYAERVRNVGRYGYGIFASHGMFRLSDEGKIEPILSADPISLSSFVGYEHERKQVIDNTEAFLLGRPAANILLYGDAGTGKSSTVKAVSNAFFDRGIRLIEIRKDQLASLPYVMGQISKNPLHFIIFIDDLSFLQSDDSFSMLKAALEGSASAKAKNAVIYATSNRRHIVKESFSDRDVGDDLHRNDTVQETLSLSERFGLCILFAKPSQKLYLDIVFELADKYNIQLPKERLRTEAEAFALRRGYRSARCAEQFIESLL